MMLSSDHFTKVIGSLEYEGLEVTILLKDLDPKAGNGLGISTLQGVKD